MVLFTASADDDETWVSIALGESARAGVTVTAESARRLLRHLAETLDRL